MPRFTVEPTTPLVGHTGPAWEVYDNHLSAAVQRVQYLQAGLRPQTVYTDRALAEADAYTLNTRYDG